MGEAPMIEGTTEEIMAWLRQAYPERNLRVMVEPQEEDLPKDLPPPPQTIRNEAHLVELLMQGLSGSKHEVSKEAWEQKRLEVRRRVAGRP